LQQILGGQVNDPPCIDTDHKKFRSRLKPEVFLTSFYQQDVASQIGVTASTIWNWGNDGSGPA